MMQCVKVRAIRKEKKERKAYFYQHILNVLHTSMLIYKVINANLLEKELYKGRDKEKFQVLNKNENK